MPAWIPCLIATLLATLPATTARAAQSTEELTALLHGIGDQLPPAPEATLLAGNPVVGWPGDQATMILITSLDDANTIRTMPQLAEYEARNTGLDFVLVIEGPVEDVRTALDAVDDFDRFPMPTVLADPESRWRTAILTPTRQEGYPLAVGVDREGRIAWHGPGQGMGPVGASLSSRDWTHENYRERIELERMRRNNAVRLFQARRDARQTGNWAAVMQLFTEVINSDPRNALPMTDRFECLLVDMKQFESGYRYGRKIADTFPDNHIVLNDLAWRTVSRPNIDVRDLDFAQEMSERANGLMGYQDYALVDTLARIHWMRGDRERAIAWQRRAVGIAPDSWHGDSTRQNLVDYTSGKVQPGTLPPPYRSPRRTR